MALVIQSLYGSPLEELVWLELQKEFLLWNLDILKQLRFRLGLALTSELPYLKETSDLPLETSHEVVLSSLLKRMSNLQTSQSSKESILSPFHVQGILLINAFSALIPGLVKTVVKGGGSSSRSCQSLVVGSINRLSTLGSIACPESEEFMDSYC